MLKIDFENQILALFDVYFWPFNKSHEKINIIFVISAIIASIWNVFIKFRWHDEKLTNGSYPVSIRYLNFIPVGNDSKASIGQECSFSDETNSKVIHLNKQKFKKYILLFYIFFF